MKYKEFYWTKNKIDAIECQRYLINKGYGWNFYGRIVKPEYICKDGTLYVIDNYGEIRYGDFSLEEAKKRADNKVIIFKSSQIKLMDTE